MGGGPGLVLGTTIGPRRRLVDLAGAIGVVSLYASVAALGWLVVVNDETSTPPDLRRAGTTVWDRLLAAGLSPDRARLHLASGAVRVAGIEVDDLSYLAPWPTRLVINPG